MKILAVLNPISGGNNKDAFIVYYKQTTRLYGIDSSIFETTGENDLEKLIDFLKNKDFDLLVAVGGDGTFALTASASAVYKIPVGVIPLGSANGMAKELGVNQSPNLAFDDLLKSRLVRKMDMISINDQIKFLHLADVGVNARIVKGFQEDSSRGMLTYGKHLAQELQEIEPFPYTVYANDQTYSGNCVMMLIANGRKFGTGVSVSDSGNPFDGTFEIAIVDVINLGTIIKAGLSVIDELFKPQNVSKLIATNHATIQFENRQLLQADGEVIGEYDELVVKALAQEILLQTHFGNPYLENSPS